MKHFLFLIWILLQKASLSLPQAKQFKPLAHFVRVNKTFLKHGEASEDKGSLRDFINEKDSMKRDVQTQTIANAFQDLLDQKDSSLMNGNLYNYPTTTKLTACPTNHSNFSPSIEGARCEQVPGKIICKIGKTTFVINNGDHNMDEEVVEKFIIMAHQRYGEGDESFDVAVDERETTICACYATETKSTAAAILEAEEPPITIECNSVSNEKLKMCNPYYDPTEKIYQCKVKTMGLKKRSTWHISVNNRGKVNFVDFPSSNQQRVRQKRELVWPQSEEELFAENNRLNFKSKRDYNDQDEASEKYDLSHLYYHTKIPYVRNYTDTCTLQYQFYPWCPEYKTYFPCELTKSDQLNVTHRPCREADSSATTSTGSLKTTGEVQSFPDGTTTLCTIEITTEEALLKEKTKRISRRKRNNMYWRRRRKLQKPLKSAEINLYNYGRRSASSLRNDRQYFADANGGDSSTQNSISQNVNPTTCVPCSSTAVLETTTICCTSTAATATGTSSTSSISSISASTQWCTMNLVPSTTPPPSIPSSTCGAVVQQTTIKSEQSEQKLKGNYMNQFQKESYIEPLRQITEINQFQIEPFANQPVQQRYEDYLSAQVDLKPQEKSMQLPPFNVIGPQNSLSRDIVKNNLRYPLGNYHERRILRNINDLSNIPQEFKQLYRPKRRMVLRKIPRFRRRQINRWMSEQRHRPDVYDQ